MYKRVMGGPRFEYILSRQAQGVGKLARTGTKMRCSVVRVGLLTGA